MLQPDRKFDLSSLKYRYGFNEQEQSTEIDPNGSNYVAEFWQYDARLGRRWNVDPVKKPWQSDYATFSGNSIWRMDPDGDDDYFNSEGVLINRTKTGSKIYVQTATGNVLLAKLPLTNANNRQTVANIVGYYVQRVGIVFQSKGSSSNLGDGIVGLKEHKTDSKDVPAFTAGNDIFINKKGGTINNDLSDYHNLESVLIHEKLHKQDNEIGKFKNLYSHIQVYLGQLKDETFKRSTVDFQEGIVGSFSNYLLNYLSGTQMALLT